MDTRYKQDPEIERLKDEYFCKVATIITLVLATICFALCCAFINEKAVDITGMLLGCISSFFCGLLIHEVDKLKEQITVKKKERVVKVDNFVKDLTKTPFTTKEDEVVVMREDKNNQVYQNLKFREQVILNPCGKIKNEKLKKEFLDTAIAQEHNQYCHWAVYIEDAVKKFKEYEFELKPAYLKVLKGYEEKQKILDEYAETKATKPRAKRKTNKKK